MSADPPPFMDTNVIVRYLTRDHPVHSPQALELFRKLERGSATVVMIEGVLIEAVNVLSSRNLYAMSREQVRDVLTPIVQFPGVRMPHKATYVRALELYASINLDIVDVLNIAHAERTGSREILSFDRDYDRVPGIKRSEP